MAKFIQRRRRVWYAVLEIPKALRPRFGGKARFFQSLQTESQTEAERKAPLVVARWRAELDRARTGKASPYVPDPAGWAGWAEDMRKASPERRYVLEDHLADAAEDMAGTDPERAESLYRVVMGRSVPLIDHLDRYLATCGDVAKTVDERRATVLRFAKVFPYTHQVVRPKVKGWVQTLLTEEKLTPKTIRKKLSFIRGYWAHLQHHDVVDEQADPFKDVIPKARNGGKEDEEAKRQPFAATDLGKFLTAAEGRKDTPLAHLIWLGAWTGCRIEELCALKLSEVSEDRITIGDAKTPAGNRLVMLHPRVQPLVWALKERSQDGYLLSGLTFNKYGDRSNAIGKRFGRLKSGLGFGPEFVFHSWRKTLTTLLENAGVPENIAADIVGHEKKTMTYGLYSGGASPETMAEALALVDYPADAPALAAAP